MSQIQIAYPDKYQHNVDSSLVDGLNNVHVGVIVTILCNIEHPELSIARVESIDLSELNLSDEFTGKLISDIKYSATDYAQTKAIDLAMAMSSSKMIVNSAGQLIELHA